MHHKKKAAKESKPDKSQAKPQSRMDSLLQGIDAVISKKTCSNKAKSPKK